MYQRTSFGTVGIKDQEKSVFQMGPNPCDDLLNIQRGSTEAIDISIIDALGRTVQKEVIYGQRISLDVSGLKPGLYTVSLGEERHQAKKLIIR